MSDSHRQEADVHNLLVAGLGVLGRVHLVDGDDELTDTEREGEEGVLAGLAVLRDAGLELTSAGSDDEDTAVGLRGAGDCAVSGMSASADALMFLIKSRWPGASMTVCEVSAAEKRDDGRSCTSASRTSTARCRS